MKKVVIAVLAILSLFAGCKKQADVTPETALPKATASSSTAPKPSSDTDTGSTNIERREAPANQTTDASMEERDFSGVWRASGTTSENSSFSSMEVEIHYDGYSVSMNFSDSTLNTTVTGTYKIKDGVLIFDDNFKDCTAYFYDGNDETLILDNGSSLVFCEKRELEEEMR